MYHFERLLDRNKNIRTSMRALFTELYDSEQEIWPLAAALVELGLGLPGKKIIKRDEETIFSLLGESATDLVNMVPYEMLWQRAKNHESTSWTDLLTWDDINLFLLHFHGGNQAVFDALTTTMHTSCALLNFDLAGRKIIEIPKEIEQQINAVSLDELPTGDAQLPVPAVYLLFPPDFPLKVHHELTGFHELEGVYIVEDKRSPARIYRTASELFGMIENKEFVRSWLFLMIGKSKDPKNEDDDATYNIAIDMKQGMTVGQAIAAPRDGIDVTLGKPEIADALVDARGIATFSTKALMYLSRLGELK